MDPKTRVVAVGGAVAMLLVVIELVRRRRLKEEYSVLWVLTALVILVLAAWYELLLEITNAIGAVLPTSTLFFSGLVFALLMLLHFSVRVSALERRVTTLVQEIGLMNAARADAAAEEPAPAEGDDHEVIEPRV
jgi:hypothetical protein